MAKILLFYFICFQTYAFKDFYQDYSLFFTQVLEEFYNIFGPELKSVTGDPKRIEDVLKRVDALVKPIEEVNFDPFSIKHSIGWKNVMEWFNREVASIEGEAKHFIDESFKSLRSAEGAFDMLQNFKHIRSREAINSQMMKKFNDILLQYGKEVCFKGIYYSC